MADVFSGVVSGITSTHNAQITITGNGSGNTTNYSGNIPVILRKVSLGLKSRNLNNLIDKYANKHVIATVIATTGGISTVDIIPDNTAVKSPLPPVKAPTGGSNTAGNGITAGAGGQLPKPPVKNNIGGSATTNNTATGSGYGTNTGTGGSSQCSMLTAQYNRMLLQWQAYQAGGGAGALPAGMTAGQVIIALQGLYKSILNDGCSVQGLGTPPIS